MVDYVVSPNLGLSQSINARMNVLMGFPNAEVKTDQYANPVEHAGDPGTWLLIVKEVGAPALPGGVATVEDINGELSPAELNSIKSRETLEAEGAFPEPEIP
jgi:hypothetical protein